MDVSRIVRFSLLIFLRFRIENIVIIKKFKFKNSKGNTILFLWESEDSIRKRILKSKNQVQIL